jgi:hypothetical protein
MKKAKVSDSNFCLFVWLSEARFRLRGLCFEIRLRDLRRPTGEVRSLPLARLRIHSRLESIGYLMCERGGRPSNGCDF